ncbi:MAG: hypothetical protein ACJAQT_003920 [Akkermansiaceae bacterium]|jgi:hypothetical protein
MKSALFGIGLSVLFACGIYSMVTSGVDRVPGESMQPHPPINVGYLLVASACFLGSAISREKTQTDPRFKFEIYRQLANGGLSFDDLMKAVAENYSTSEHEQPAPLTTKIALNKMLDEGHLIIRDGLLKIAS